MSQLPDLDHLSHAEKDALIRALWSEVQSLTTRLADVEARLAEPSKTPDNSSLAAKAVAARWPALSTKR